MVANYGMRLETSMRTRGVSTQQLATQLGVSYQAVNKVLKGQSAAFSASNNAYAARFLEVSGDWLATGEGQMIDKAHQYALSEGSEDMLTAWKSASEENKEVARFALSDLDAPLPAWADKDMRKDMDSMRYAALRWLRTEKPGKEAPPPQKVRGAA